MYFKPLFFLFAHITGGIMTKRKGDELMEQKRCCVVWAGNSGIESYITASNETEAIAKVQKELRDGFGIELSVKDCYEVR